MNTANQIFGNTVNAVVIDEWTEWNPTRAAKPAPPKYLDFNTPPLALVLAMLDAGKDVVQIYSTLSSLGESPHIKVETAVEARHQAQAAEIYNYFAKKHTMRRIKDEFISEYMLALDDLIDNKKRINEESVKILVSLPRIYEQNRALERAMKGRNSAKKIDTLSFSAWRGEVEFVERVLIKSKSHSKSHSEYQYYFSTPKNYLMRIVVKKGQYGSNAWDLLAEHGKLHISADVTYTYNLKGYDFNVLQPSPEHTKIKIA
jgi:hypothetical protein